MAIVVTATPDPTSGAIAVHATVDAGITAVTVGRNDPSGFQQLLRYGSSVPVVGGVVDVLDYEAPMDVPVTYVVTQLTPTGNGSGTSASVTLQSKGKTWLKDPSYPTRNFVVPVVTSIQQLTRPARAGVFEIIDRATPIVVNSVRGSGRGTLVCYTLTDDQRAQMVDILARGTVLLLQSPPAYGWGSVYVSVGDAVESRVGLAYEQSRMWTLPFTVVDRPEGVSTAPVVDKSWQAVKTKYGTWGDLIATGKTNDQLLQEGP